MKKYLNKIFKIFMLRYILLRNIKTYRATNEFHYKKSQKNNTFSIVRKLKIRETISVIETHCAV